MTLLKTPSNHAPSSAVKTEVAAPSDLTKGLGVLGNWQVTRAERAAKARAAASLAVCAAEASEDAGRHAIELKVSEIKSALTARAVPALAAIQTELVGRLGQAKNLMSATWAEGLKGQIVLRHQLLVELEQLAAEGMLTPGELAEAKEMIEQDAARDITALRNATGRAMEAMDAHASRATDHIAKEGNSY